jgi:hypothetical protein
LSRVSDLPASSLLTLYNITGNNSHNFVLCAYFSLSIILRLLTEVAALMLML